MLRERLGKGEMIMNWRNVAIGLGQSLGVLSQACRSRDRGAVPHRLRVGGLTACVVLLLVSPVAAGDSYPVPDSFADGLTAQSSWEQILKKYPGIQAEFPMVNFGKTFVPFSAVCLDREMLRIADPRIDNGVRVSAVLAPGHVQSRRAMSGYAAVRADRFAVGPVAAPEPRLHEQPDQPLHARIRYPVSVYKVRPTLTGIERVFLFEKPWEIPTCSTR